MRKQLKKKLDFIPLIILFSSGLYTAWTYFDKQIVLKWQHYIGFCMLAMTAILFYRNHKLGVLSLGLTVILGLIGLVSLTPGISSAWIGKGDYVLLRFQPIFILWTTIHFALSGRYYVGVASSKYWEDIESDEPYKMP